MTTFTLIESIIDTIANSNSKNALAYTEIVHQYYSKIVTFVLQNDNASTFQKSFYLYGLYNREFFQEKLEKYQLLFPKINKKEQTTVIENLKSNNAYNLFILSNEKVDDIAENFIKAALLNDWDMSDLYKHSSNFLISLCQNSLSEELPTNFLKAFHDSLEEAYKSKDKDFPTAEFEKQMLRPLIHSSTGELCYDIYNKSSTNPKALGTEEKGFLSANGAYIHSYYNTTDGFSLDKLSAKLAKINCEDVTDQSLIWKFFTSDNFIEFFNKFTQYTYPKCFATFTVQMIAQGKEDLLDKTIEFLNNKNEDKNQPREISDFKKIYKNPMFWHKVNELLNENYTVEKHTAFCHFWMFRVSQEFRGDIIKYSKGQDHYGYMKLCELSKLQDDSSSEAMVRSSISAYGNTDLLGIINYLISEKLRFDHSKENNLFEQIHQKVEKKLPQIAQAKEEVATEMFNHNINKMIADNPEEVLKLLQGIQGKTPLGAALITKSHTSVTNEYGGEDVTSGQLNIGAIENKLKNYLSNKTCDASPGLLCDYIVTPLKEFTCNSYAITGASLLMGYSAFFGDARVVLFIAYDGIILGNAQGGQMSRVDAAYTLFLTNIGTPLSAVYKVFAPIIYTATVGTLSLAEKGFCDITMPQQDLADVLLVVTQNIANENEVDIKLSESSSCTKELVENFCLESDLHCNIIIEF